MRVRADPHDRRRAARRPYRTGEFTHKAYTAAWGDPPARYWLDADEHTRRVGVVTELLDSVGLHDRGRRHTLTFAESVS